MKKIILLALIAMFVSMPVSIAQESNSYYPPLQGDISLGLDLNPLLNFTGNMFNNTVDNNMSDMGGNPYSVYSSSLAYSFKPTVSIVGKYMLTDFIALRANLGWITYNNTDRAYAIDDLAAVNNPLAHAKVIDEQINRKSGASLALGAEYRVGRGRVVGVFGVNLLYAFSEVTTQNEYGNIITDINQKPTISLGSYTSLPSMPNARVTESYAAIHAAGLVGTIGVEWFMAPQISLGAEVNLSAVWSWSPVSYASYEGYNELSGLIEPYNNLTNPLQNAFMFGTQNIGANLSINFYF